MATLEELNRILSAPAERRQIMERAEADYAPLVRGLMAIAERLEGLAGNDDASSALAPIADAIRGIEIPAPVVNVEAPTVNVEPARVSVEIERLPPRAVVTRDEHGLIKFIDFTDIPEDEPDDDIETLE